MNDEKKKDSLFGCMVAIVIIALVCFVIFVIVTSETVETDKEIIDILIGYERQDSWSPEYLIKFSDTSVVVYLPDIDYIKLFIGKPVSFTYTERYVSSLLQPGSSSNIYDGIEFHVKIN